MRGSSTHQDSLFLFLGQVLVAEAAGHAAAEVVFGAFMVFWGLVIDVVLTSTSALRLAAQKPSIIETGRIKLSVSLCGLRLAHLIHLVVALLSLEHALEQLALRQLVVFVLNDTA